METTSGNKARLGLLTFLFVGAMVAVIRALLMSSGEDDKSAVLPLETPASVPLTQWQIVEGNFPKVEEESYKYQYISNQKSSNKNQTLEVQTSYRKYDGGNVSRLLFIEASIPPATVMMRMKQKEGMGFYGMFEYDNKAHITGCINRAGESSVTNAQHTQNKYKYGWGIQRTLLWFIGYKDLFETACLWTLISTPVTSNLDSTTLDKTYENLETAWVEWYSWWKPKLESKEVQ